MYLVKAKNAADSGWKTIYDSSDKALCLMFQPKHDREMNQPGSFDFTIYTDSDFYDAIVPMDTFISAFEGTDAEHLEETFYGRVLTCEDDFYGTKNVSCEGVLSFLKDATVGHVSTDEHNSGREYRTSPQAFLQEHLAAYNAKVEERKKIFYGGVSGITASNAELFKIDDDQDFKSLLENQLIDVFGGFFKINRRQNGTHELWYVKNYGINVGTAQAIQIGQNILDKQKHMTGEGVFTFIRPVGKDGVRLDDGVYHGVSCNSSNGRSGLYPVGTDAASFNALYARYGFIEKPKSFEDCETSAALANSCAKYVRDYGLDALGKLPMTFDVKLVDFFNANPNVKRIELGANYILTVDSEGRETGFEGHADGTPAQEGQEGLTLTVYSVHREYENPENDSVTFYNATYLTAKDYSIILSSMTGSYSGSYGGGGSRGGLSGLMSSSEADMREEQAEEGRKVEKRFIDDEDSIGMVVTITENGKVINAGGIWTEITGTDKTLLQGTLDVDLVALRSGAVITAINNNEEDGTSLTIDFDRLNITSGAVITAINNETSSERSITIDFDRLNITGGTLINVINGDDPSKTGDLAINASRIKLQATDTITLDALLGIQANTGYLRVNGSLSVKNNIFATDNISLGDTLTIGSSTGTQGEESGRMFFRGTEYTEKQMIMGVTSPFIVSGRVLGNFVAENINLNHSHAVAMTEQTSGAHAGQVHAVIGEPVTYSSSSTANRESFFDIAASQTYINGVAAAYQDAVDRVLWPSPPKTGWYCAVRAPGPVDQDGEHTTQEKWFAINMPALSDWDTARKIITIEMMHEEEGVVVTDGMVAARGLNISDTEYFMNEMAAKDAEALEAVTAATTTDILFSPTTTPEYDESTNGLTFNANLLAGRYDDDHDWVLLRTVTKEITVNGQPAYNAGMDDSANTLRLLDKDHINISSTTVNLDYDQQYDVIARANKSDGTYMEKSVTLIAPSQSSQPPQPPQPSSSFDINELSVNIGSESDPWDVSPSKRVGEIWGQIGVRYGGVDYGALRWFSISAPEVTGVFHDSRDCSSDITVYLDYNNGGGRVSFTSRAR